MERAAGKRVVKSREQVKPAGLRKLAPQIFPPRETATTTGGPSAGLPDMHLPNNVNLLPSPSDPLLVGTGLGATNNPPLVNPDVLLDPALRDVAEYGPTPGPRTWEINEGETLNRNLERLVNLYAQGRAPGTDEAQHGIQNPVLGYQDAAQWGLTLQQTAALAGALTAADLAHFPQLLNHAEMVDFHGPEWYAQSHLTRGPPYHGRSTTTTTTTSSYIEELLSHPGSAGNGHSTTGTSMTNPSTTSDTVCAMCGKEFDIPSKMRRHARCHLPKNDRPFPCLFQGCDKRFVDSRDAGRCYLKHTGAKPFPCDEPGCNWRFARNDQLQRHRAAKHA